MIGRADFWRSASGARLQRVLAAIVLARLERRLIHCFEGRSVAPIMPQREQCRRVLASCSVYKGPTVGGGQANRSEKGVRLGANLPWKDGIVQSFSIISAK